MPELRYYKNRVINNRSDGIERGGDVLICMSEFVWFLLRDLAYGYGLRPSTYAIEYHEQYYVAPDQVGMDLIDSYISEFLAGDDMTCDLSGALTSLAEALSGGCCSGQGSGCAPGTDVPPGAYTDDGEEAPPNFGSISEYKAYKCQAANWLVKCWDSDARYLEGAEIVALTASGLAVFLLTPIPLDDLITLAGIALAFAVEGLLTGYADEIGDWLEADATDVVCALYTSETAADATTSVLALADAALSLGAYTLFSSFLWYSGVNQLFEYNSRVENSALTMAVDCADCFPTDHFTYYGTQVGPVTWESELDSGVYHVAIAFYSEDWTTSASPTQLLEVALGTMPGFTPVEDSTHAYRARTTMPLGSECTGWDVYCTDDKPVDYECVKKLDLRSSTPFTVNFAFGSDC